MGKKKNKLGYQGRIEDIASMIDEALRGRGSRLIDARPTTADTLYFIPAIEALSVMESVEQVFAAHRKNKPVCTNRFCICKSVGGLITCVVPNGIMLAMCKKMGAEFTSLIMEHQVTADTYSLGITVGRELMRKLANIFGGWDDLYVPVEVDFTTRSVKLPIMDINGELVVVKVDPNDSYHGIFDGTGVTTTV